VFEFQLKSSVEKDLQALPKADQQRVIEHIETVLVTDRYAGKALSGEFKGLFRWRIGQFRVIYEIQKDVLIILVIKIGLRKGTAK